MNEQAENHGCLVLSSTPATQAEKLSDVVVAPKQDSSKGVYLCVYCNKLIGSAMVGAGDGTGERFAHPDCYLLIEQAENHGCLVLSSTPATQALHSIRDGIKRPEDWQSERWQVIASYKHAYDDYLWSCVAIEKELAGDPSAARHSRMYVYWNCFNGTDGGMGGGVYNLTRAEAMNLLIDQSRMY